MSEPLVVTQLLIFGWGKEARGGHLATIRRQKEKQELPSGYSLSPKSRSLVQILEFNGDDAYTKVRTKIKEYEDSLSAVPTILSLRVSGDTLQVFGANIVKQEVVALTEGQTARFEYNQRISLEHTWRYMHTIVNVGYATRPLKPRLFFRETDYHLSNLSNLYQANLNP